MARRIDDESHKQPQYVLGYHPEPRRNDGRWRKVRVRAGPGAKMRAREGYVDY